MKIKDLEYYQKLIQEKNFSKVAADFKVSQPTITMSIKRLESDFKTSFFIRDHAHKELHVTPAGQQFANHVNVILNELTIARQEIDRTKSTRIRFGLPPIIGNYYFPPLTPMLMRADLMPLLDTFEHGSRELLKMLEHGQLDIALLGSLKSLDQPRLKTAEFAHYPFKVIVSKNHPLASKAAITFRELKDEQFIIPSSEFFHEQAFKQMCHGAHFRPHILFRTPDIHVIKAMVAENLGVSFLTSLAISPTDQVTTLNITDNDQPHFRLSLARRETELLSTNEEKLWQLLVKQEK